MNPADNLRLWSERLTEPRRHKLERDHGGSDWITLPPLLDQLEDDLAATGGLSGRSKPGSRPPLNMTVFSLLTEIEVVLRDAMQGEGLDRRDTLRGMLVAIVAHLTSTADPDVLLWWQSLVRGWVGECEACLPGEDTGPSTRPIRGLSCPNCLTWTIQRISGGETYRDPAIVLIFHNRYVRYALCNACGESWARGDALLALADSQGVVDYPIPA